MVPRTSHGAPSSAHQRRRRDWFQDGRRCLHALPPAQYAGAATVAVAHDLWQWAARRCAHLPRRSRTHYPDNHATLRLRTALTIEGANARDEGANNFISETRCRRVSSGQTVHTANENRRAWSGRPGIFAPRPYEQRERIVLHPGRPGNALTASPYHWADGLGVRANVVRSTLTIPNFGR